MIPLFVGSDDREAIGLAAFSKSVWDRASQPVGIYSLGSPLKGLWGGQRDGSNGFIYSRFLIPFLCDYSGFAIFADGSDMLCRADIAELWAMRDPLKAVQVVQHDYKTSHPTKYFDQPNPDYPRKNWSSLILWNCAHLRNRKLTPESVKEMSGEYLHRFGWLDDRFVGELPKEWNYLIGERNQALTAKIAHFSIGLPCWDRYKDCEHADEWRDAVKAANNYQQWGG